MLRIAHTYIAGLIRPQWSPSSHGLAASRRPLVRPGLPPAALAIVRPTRLNTRSDTLTWTLAAVVAASLLFVLATDGGRNARLPAADAEFSDVARRIGLGIETIVLTGHKHAADRAIYAALELEQNPMLIGFDPGAARTRIEAVSWIDRATVTRVFPNVVRVEVQERRPIALWRSPDGEVLVDRTGRTLGPVGDVPVAGLLVIAGPQAGPRTGEILSLLAPEPALRDRVREARYIGERRWMLSLTDGPSIQLPAEGAGKALARLMSHPDKTRLMSTSVATIDLRGRTGIIAMYTDDKIQKQKSPGAGHRS